ncbi:restriction endonuclease subunit S [Salmonella enterica subsp. enterica serovar Agona]|nr:restriction endonuclease subunit S [Salmonella enterica subsp. enterica serovar Agona]
MSEMSYLEKLLDGVEVEWKTLGSIAELKRGTSITKKDVIDGTIPVVAGGRTPAYYHNTSNRDGQTIVIAGSGAYAGFVSWWEEPIFVSDAFTVKPHNILLPRYCYHFLMNMQQQLHDFKSGGGVPHVYPRDVSPILIPIPCPDNPERSLAIQSEIVRILDKFTALTAELTAELTMRKKQYNYYRDQLLSFDDDEVEWKTLGEIGTWHGGGTPSKSRSEFWEDGSIPWISPKDMGRPIVDTSEDYITEEAVEQSSTKLVPANSIAIVVRSSILDKVMPSALIPVPATFNQDMKVVIPHCNISPNYIAHIMRSRGDDILRAAKKSGGSVASIDSKKLFSFRIPVPHLNEQKRIVNILDKFDTLANSITEGLPREIELRQKQYEYYRDLLFSFPKPEATSN